MIIQLQSLANLQPGRYLLNAYGGLGAQAGNVVHRTNCPIIRRMDLQTPKYWADTVVELQAELQRHGGDFDPDRPRCRICRP
jgi:hypothetical protein